MAGWDMSRPDGLLLSGDGAGQLALRHLRAARDAEAPCPLVELLLRVLLDVDAAERLPLAPALLRRRLLRARIARAGLALRNPAVAALLVRALQRGHRRPVGALALAVLLGRRVVRLRERPLRLRAGALQRVRQLRAPHPVLRRHLRHLSRRPPG